MQTSISNVKADAAETRQLKWVSDTMKQELSNVTSMFKYAAYGMFGNNTYSATTLDKKEKELEGYRKAAVNTMALFLAIDADTKSENMTKFLSTLNTVTEQLKPQYAVTAETASHPFVKIATLMKTEILIIELMSNVAAEALRGSKVAPILLQDQKEDRTAECKSDAIKEMAEFLALDMTPKGINMKCIVQVLGRDESIKYLIEDGGLSELIAAEVVEPTVKPSQLKVINASLLRVPNKAQKTEYVLTKLGHEVAALLEKTNERR